MKIIENRLKNVKSTLDIKNGSGTIVRVKIILQYWNPDSQFLETPIETSNKANKTAFSVYRTPESQAILKKSI